MDNKRGTFIRSSNSIDRKNQSNKKGHGLGVYGGGSQTQIRGLQAAFVLCFPFLFSLNSTSTKEDATLIDSPLSKRRRNPLLLLFFCLHFQLTQALLRFPQQGLCFREGIDCLLVIMKLVELQMKIMKQIISSFMALSLLSPFLLFHMLPTVSGNAEGNALNALKSNLKDPNNVLQNWNPHQANPCMWFGVTCNINNSVTRLDLGGVNLLGELVPQLGQLPNLQYLELHNNGISGKIPDDLGNLTNLVSLDLYWNGLSGPIPDTLGNLEKLRILRLNHNNLSGNIPMSLTSIASLQSIDLSDNQLKGDIPVNGSFSLFTPTSFQNNPGLRLPKYSPYPSPSSLSGGPSSPESSSVKSAPGLSSGPGSEKSQAPSSSPGYFAASYVPSLFLPLFIAIFSAF